MNETKDIIRKTRGEQTQDDFAEEMTAAFNPYRRILRQHISMWERGVNRPDIFSMLYLLDHAPERFSKMASKIVIIIQNGS